MCIHAHMCIDGVAWLGQTPSLFSMQFAFRVGILPMFCQHIDHRFDMASANVIMCMNAHICINAPMSINEGLCINEGMCISAETPRTSFVLMFGMRFFQVQFLFGGSVRLIYMIAPMNEFKFNRKQTRTQARADRNKLKLKSSCIEIRIGQESN